jgi:hypothetical protein
MIEGRLRAWIVGMREETCIGLGNDQGSLSEGWRWRRAILIPLSAGVGATPRSVPKRAGGAMVPLIWAATCGAFQTFARRRSVTKEASA